MEGGDQLEIKSDGRQNRVREQTESLKCQIAFPINYYEPKLLPIVELCWRRRAVARQRQVSVAV